MLLWQLVYTRGFGVVDSQFSGHCMVAFRTSSPRYTPVFLKNQLIAKSLIKITSRSLYDLDQIWHVSSWSETQKLIFCWDGGVTLFFFSCRCCRLKQRLPDHLYICYINYRSQTPNISYFLFLKTNIAQRHSIRISWRVLSFLKIIK